MRLSVSGKIFVAYTVLATVFLASSVLTLVYMYRARSRVVASQTLFDVQADLDDAWRKLQSVPTTVVRRPDPKRPLAFVLARRQVASALETLDRYQGGESGKWFSPIEGADAFRVQIVELQTRLGLVADGLAAFEASEDDESRQAFVAKLTTLIYHMDRTRRSIRGESRTIATLMRIDEESARNLALLMAGAGLFVALGVALSMMRTLRPLRVLRERARAVAGGDYAQRIEVHSQDEIGDLAREFDVMSAAIKEREQRLIRSEQLATIGRMAAQITHEIRNPLASIGLNAELLADDLATGRPESLGQLQAIVREVDRLSEITENYLRFVRLPRGTREPEDMGAIVNSVLAFARAELERAGVTVSISVAAEVPEVNADEGQVRQAVLNLVRNAREAMPDGGQITVAVLKVGNEVHVRIGDSGSGIDADNLPQLFDPFFSTKKKGTGLGLALVQQIVVDHGGRVTVESPAGKGSVFGLVFPLEKPSTGSSTASTGVPAAISSEVLQ
ncbi:MAG: ATP-binding protein [Deltaproteobacteria bacterium]|nr:ATP-binding protein [Deltaproteobacteria bacterium]